MHPVLFQIGPLTIYSPGVFWALAAMCAGWVARLELKGHLVRWVARRHCGSHMGCPAQWNTLAYSTNPKRHGGIR